MENGGTYNDVNERIRLIDSIMNRKLNTVLNIRLDSFIRPLPKNQSQWTHLSFVICCPSSWVSCTVGFIFKNVRYQKINRWSSQNNVVAFVVDGWWLILCLCVLFPLLFDFEIVTLKYVSFTSHDRRYVICEC